MGVGGKRGGVVVGGGFFLSQLGRNARVGGLGVFGVWSVEWVGEGGGGCGNGRVFFCGWVIGGGRVCVLRIGSLFSSVVTVWSSCQVLVPQSRFPPSTPQLKPSFPPSCQNHTHPFLSRQLFNLRSFPDAPPLSPPLSPNPPPTSTALSSVTPNHIPSTRNHPRALESLKRLEPRRNRINLFQEPR